MGWTQVRQLFVFRVDLDIPASADQAHAELPARRPDPQPLNKSGPPVPKARNGEETSGLKV